MNLHELAERIASGTLKETFMSDFPAEAVARLQRMTADEIEQLLEQMFQIPLNLSHPISVELYQLYYMVSWQQIFAALEFPSDAKVFEIAAGDTVHIPKALDAYSEHASYITANLNTALSERFMDKVSGLRIDLRIIEDDGVRILDYVPEHSVDLVAFHHAVNDIVQTIIARIEDIDTVNSDWWTIEPQMLQAVMAYHDRGELKAAVFDEFIAIISTCCQLLKPGGYLVFDNCTFEGYEDIGYSTSFHSGYIELTRQWIQEASLGLQEVQLEGYDCQHGWLMLRKV